VSEFFLVTTEIINSMHTVSLLIFFVMVGMRMASIPTLLVDDASPCQEQMDGWMDGWMYNVFLKEFY
jgi:hypothetical protein